MRQDRPTAADVFRRHHVAVWRFLSRQTGNGADADDLGQETFLRVARSFERYREHGTERAWVFRIARNVLANHRRDRSRRLEVGPEPSDARIAAHPVAGLRLGLDEALSRLPETDREVFLLREVGGLGYEEIAATCDLTPAAVRNRIHRARRALRATLAPSAEPGFLNEVSS